MERKKMSKKITVENMTVEDARENLGSWVLHSAVLSRHRAMQKPLDRLAGLTDRAYQLLGHEDYAVIHEQVKRDHS